MLVPLITHNSSSPPPFLSFPHQLHLLYTYPSSCNPSALPFAIGFSNHHLHQTMDVVLEVFDTFLFDRFWSTVYPASTFHTPKNLVADATTTFSSMRELPTPIHSSTQFFQLAPSRYAYMSEWPRDNLCRQFCSLYLITWYASLFIHVMSYHHHIPQSCFLTSPLGFSAWCSTSSLPLSHTSLSSTMPPSLTPSTSNTKSGLRFAKP